MVSSGAVGDLTCACALCRDAAGRLHADSSHLPDGRQVPAGPAAAVSFTLSAHWPSQRPQLEPVQRFTMKPGQAWLRLYPGGGAVGYFTWAAVPQVATRMKLLVLKVSLCFESRRFEELPDVLAFRHKVSLPHATHANSGLGSTP